jgi:hypothetical protein
MRRKSGGDEALNKPQNMKLLELFTREERMRLTTAIAIAFLSTTSIAAAQTAEQVKTDILSALATPLPITVIGPVMAQDVKVTEAGGAFQAELVNPMLMGILPMGSMSFTLTPEGEKAYRVSNFKLPEKLDLMNAATLGIGGTTFDGVWSTESRSYRTLKFALNDVSVLPKSMPEAKVSIGNLTLDVAKEGESGATESSFALKVANISSRGLPPNNIDVKSVTAQLRANGEQPVDLYSVVSRLAVLSVMQQDSNALLQFAESLRAQKYDTVTLNLEADGIEATGSFPGSNEKVTIAKASAVAGLTGVTPDEWATMTLAVDSSGITDNGVFCFAEMRADSGSLSIDGSRIPIGATLNAISKLDALSRGETTSYRVSELLDGFLNMGAIKVKSDASGIVYVPRNEDEPSVRFSKFSLESGTEGFRDGKGKLLFASAVEGMNLIIKHFPRAIDAKAYGVFNPQVIRYDLSISDLNEQLLRKLFANSVVSSEQDIAGLVVPALAYAMSLKPVIETKDLRFTSVQVDIGSSGSLRFYPAWVLGAMPYEGEQTLRVKGIDKIAGFLADYKSTPPDQGGMGVADASSVAIGESILTTFEALAKKDSSSLVWSIKYPKAGQALFSINDIELRFPDLTGLVGPMMGYGMLGSLGSSPYVPPPAEAPLAEPAPNP